MKSTILASMLGLGSITSGILLIADPVVAQSLAQISGIQVQSSDEGIQIEIETASGSAPRFLTPSPNYRNVLVIDLLDAELASGSLSQSNPAPGIQLVRVDRRTEDSVRLTIIGSDQLPPVTMQASDPGVVVSLGSSVPVAAQPTPLADPTPASDPTPVASEPTPEQEPPEFEVDEITVTADRPTTYAPPFNASTATGTDTPILKTPASLQVIPRQVLEDQQVTRLDEALQNSSSVIFNSTETFSDVNYSIRGFDQAPVLIDGFRQYDFAEIPEVANIQQIEILKGPASILYGEIQPGGVINLVTEKPSLEPFYDIDFQAGSFGFYRPQFDWSGPLTEDGRLAYRVNGVYSHRDGFRNFDQDFEQFFGAAALSWQVSEQTNLSVDLQLSDREQPWDFGTIAIGNQVISTPRERIFNEPNDFLKRNFLSLKLALDHQFSDAWSVSTTFRLSDSSVFSDRLSIPIAFDDETGSLLRVFALDNFDSRNYSLQTNLAGKVSTGSIDHNLLFGVDLSRTKTSEFALANFTPFSINVFDPVYGVDRPAFDTLLFDTDTETDRLGLYLQDQITFSDQLNLVLGLRYDAVDQDIDNIPALFAPGGDTTQFDDAFSPRVGLVYQPNEDLSLYASYSQSFTPNEGVDNNSNPFAPERGEGYEVGVKAELLSSRLLATLAYFNIRRENILTEDPAFPGLGVSIATGEQQSRGFELDLAGEILPGWNLIASYAYTDAEITEDNTFTVGNQLTGIPLNSANIWTTYEIQQGAWQGFGFGAGLNYLDSRQGDLSNSFQLDSFIVTNAALFYRNDQWQAALNFRNLFDVDYTNSRGRFGSRTSAGLPGDPFTVVGTISASF